MKMIIYLVLAGLSLAEDFKCDRTPKTFPDCVSNAFKNIPQSLDTYKEFACGSDCKIDCRANSKSYEELTTVFLRALDCSACNAEDFLAIGEAYTGCKEKITYEEVANLFIEALECSACRAEDLSAIGKTFQDALGAAGQEATDLLNAAATNPSNDCRANNKAYEELATVFLRALDCSTCGADDLSSSLESLGAAGQEAIDLLKRAAIKASNDCRANRKSYEKLAKTFVRDLECSMYDADDLLAIGEAYLESLRATGQATRDLSKSAATKPSDCSGCTVNDLLSTEKTSPDLLEATGQQAIDLVKAAMMTPEILGVTKPVAELTCSMFKNTLVPKFATIMADADSNKTEKFCKADIDKLQSQDMIEILNGIGETIDVRDLKKLNRELAKDLEGSLRSSLKTMQRNKSLCGSHKK